MVDRIESAFGTTLKFPENSSIGQANKTITEKKAQGKDVLTSWADEFDVVITKINSLKASQVDGRVTPHLRTTLEDLSTLNLHLPTLKELRESEDPEVRERVDGVMEKIREGMLEDNEQWGWLDKLKTPRLVTSSLFIDGYNEILAQDPKFQKLGFEKDKNVVRRTIEEASVLYHPKFGINRAASKYYTIAEGFTQDFIDFSQAVRLIEICTMLEPKILSRKNMDMVWKFIKENPYDVLTMMRTLNQSIENLNKITKSHDINVKLKNTYEAQVALSDHPVPLIVGEQDKGLNIGFLKILKRALKRTNYEMAIGESVEKTSDLPERIQKDFTYSRFHVEVSDPKAIFAGLITHMVEFWTKENPAYRHLGPSTFINALCETIGWKYSDSELFRVLYDPNGLNWYAQEWGFTKEFCEYLEQKQK